MHFSGLPFAFVGAVAPYHCSVDHRHRGSHRDHSTLHRYTIMNAANNTTREEAKANTLVSICCLAFFPAMYFIGSTISSFLA